MQLFDLTLDTPQENLALDEALLDEAEGAGRSLEFLRIWESPEPFIVLGRSSRAAAEVNLAYCGSRGIRVLRRSSGGSAVVVAPGSLMYAVVLSYESRPQLRMLDETHRFVLGKIATALGGLAAGAAHRGTSDLALGALKFSGNSMRCKRRHLLYHGTLLYALEPALVEHCLAMPPRQPDYRANRPHVGFLTNLPTDADTLRAVLINAWQARPARQDWPRQRVRDLVAQRYGREAWTFQR